MSDYDPFARGPHPCGTRSFDWKDAERERTLPVEVWYPATDEHRGDDLDPNSQDHYQSMPMAPAVSQSAVRNAAPLPGPFPLVVFSHGFGGDRRQTTHLCTHLASHGYAVASMDHVGNTAADLLAMAGTAPDPDMLENLIAVRPGDARFVLDCMASGDAGIDIDTDRIGMTGHSFGGWTTLATTALDERIKAALPLAPAGGDGPLMPPEIGNAFGDSLDLEWNRAVPTLLLLAELDSLLPLSGMRELYGRIREPRAAVVLRNSDHFHFCDRVEQTHDLFKNMGALLVGSAPIGAGLPDMSAIFDTMKASSDLASGDQAYAMTCGLGLAHFDAHVRDDPAAAALIGGDLVALMAGRGVEVELL